MEHRDRAAVEIEHAPRRIQHLGMNGCRDSMTWCAGTMCQRGRRGSNSWRLQGRLAHERHREQQLTKHEQPKLEGSWMRPAAVWGASDALHACQSSKGRHRAHQRQAALPGQLRQCGGAAPRLRQHQVQAATGAVLCSSSVVWKGASLGKAAREATAEEWESVDSAHASVIRNRQVRMRPVHCPATRCSPVTMQGGLWQTAKKDTQLGWRRAAISPASSSSWPTI